MPLKKSDPETFSRVLDVLSGGGIVVMPCDTIYGIVGIAPETENRIRTVKGRGETKPFLRLIPSASVLREYTTMEIPPGILRYWPGPLTLIVPMIEGGTVALRVPGDPILLRLMDELGKALFSTSVNRSGEASLWKIGDIEAEFSTDVDLIVDDGDLEGKLPSTILDLSVLPFRILRQGAAVIPQDLLS